MNRLLVMVLRNFWRVPTAYGKLCHYAKHREQYDEKVKYEHIQYIITTLQLFLIKDAAQGTFNV